MNHYKINPKFNCMKKYVLVLASFSFVFNSHGQNDLWKVVGHEFSMNNGIDWQASNLHKEKDELKENHVKSREKINYNHGKTSTTKQVFNKSGLVTEISRTMKGKISKINYKYDSNDNMTSIISINNNGDTWKSNYTYNNLGYLIERSTIDNKGKYNGSRIKYNTGGKIILEEIYKTDDINPVKSLEYTFYEDGNKKSTTYREKGEIKYEWHFECKSEGELLNVKNKDKSTICIKEETDVDGNRIVWKREFDDKGELTKVKITYDKDSTWLGSLIFNSEDKLISKNVHKKDDGYIFIKYKNEKIKSSYETFKNLDQQIIKTVSKSKRWQSTTIDHYKNKLKVLEVRIYNRRTYTNEYIYTFY